MVSMEDWFITSSDPAGSEVIPNVQKYRLVNRKINAPLRYGKRKRGINLDWGLKFENEMNIRFGSMEGEGPFRYGDSIAIHIDGGGYLRQAYRPVGENLVWKSTPVYHWRIFGVNGTYGAVVKTNDQISIYSKTMEAYLVYRQQLFGINLGFRA